MHPIYLAGWILARTMSRLWFRARFYNPERVPKIGPAVLAANHLSFIDPPLIGAGIHRQIGYLARESLFRYPGIGWLLHTWGTIPVDREGSGFSGLKGVLEQLAAGKATLLFPEGTRSRDGKFQSARSGIGLAVIKSGAPVVPVRVFGTFEAFGRHHRFPRPRPVAVKYGRLMRFEQQKLESQTCTKSRLKEIYQEVASEIMAAIASLQPFEDKETFP